MTEAIIVAIITGGLSLLGVIITNSKSARDMDAKLDKQLSVTDAHLESLTKEVRKHNGFAERIPAIEGHISLIDERIKVANHRIDDLEKHGQATNAGKEN